MSSTKSHVALLACERREHLVELLHKVSYKCLVGGNDHILSVVKHSYAHTGIVYLSLSLSLTLSLVVRTLTRPIERSIDESRPVHNGKLVMHVELRLVVGDGETRFFHAVHVVASVRHCNRDNESLLSTDRQTCPLSYSSHRRQ